MLKEIIDKRIRQKLKIKNQKQWNFIWKLFAVGFIIGALLCFVGWILGG